MCWRVIQTGFWLPLRQKHNIVSCKFSSSAGIGLSLAMALLAGCATPPPVSRTSAPATQPSKAVEQIQLSKTEFGDLPGWTVADMKAAFGAFLRSCGEINRRAPTSVAGKGYGGTAADWQAACRASVAEQADPKSFFARWFVPFTVTASAPSLFTGYYEPEIAVSRFKSATYQTPVYGLPSDLISVDLGAFRAKLAGERLAGRVEKGKLVPYASRSEIETKGLKSAPVLFYAADPVALFFLQIQGSGRALLPDGEQMRLSYAGQNGHPYTAIGKVLMDRGALARGTVTADSIRDWLKTHPDEAASVMQTNASYVFFQAEKLGDPSVGAKGSEGVPLTAGASIAIDPAYHPYGLPVFIATTRPDGAPWNALFIAQDRGGAIRGAGRADLYLGVGAGPESLAGLMKQPGTMYILLPKSVADRLPSRYAYDAP